MKRFLSLLLTAALCAASLPVSFADAGFPVGDVDLDGFADAFDLTKLARSVGGIEALAAEGYVLSETKGVYALGDVDFDGTVGAFDLTALARSVGGIEALTAVGTAYAGTYLPTASEGLEYRKNDDGVSYAVVDMGTCTDLDVVVPSEYCGLPVTGVADWAFCLPDPSFTDYVPFRSLTLPEGVTFIGEHALMYRKELKTVVFPSTLTEVGDGALNGCESLESLSLPASLTDIGDAFSGCTALKTLTVASENPTYYAAGNCLIRRDTQTLLLGTNESTIPDGVKAIDLEAFASCPNLETVAIPASVTAIGQNAFRNTAFYKEQSNWTDGVLYSGACLLAAKGVTSLTVRDGTAMVADGAFSASAGLVSLTLPASVKNLGSNLFASSCTLKEITFAGTEEAWEAVTKAVRWDANLGKYTVLFAE